MTKQKILNKGAEAIIYLEKDMVVKKRLPKSYRLEELDNKIRKSRTKSETKILHKASGIIDSPKPIETENWDEIKIPFIDGKKLSENLDNFSLEKQKEICRKIGESIAKLHDKDIIHGDLTTSNMIFVENSDNKTKKQKFKIFFIDFGLGFISKKFEDKAVDLHLLKEALEAKHFKNFSILFEEVFKGYKKSENYEKTIQRFKKVEKRGRYKEQY